MRDARTSPPSSPRKRGSITSVRSIETAERGHGAPTTSPACMGPRFRRDDMWTERWRLRPSVPSLLTIILFRTISSIVLFARGAVMRRQVAGQDAVSCARASQARPGRPGVAVRAHYGALPLFVGWTRDRRTAGNRREPRPRKHGPPAQNHRGGALTGAAVRREADRVPSTTLAPVGALPPLVGSRGELPQSSGARRRENARGWLFESCIGISTDCRAGRAATDDGVLSWPSAPPRSVPRPPAGRGRRRR